MSVTLASRFFLSAAAEAIAEAAGIVFGIVLVLEPRNPMKNKLVILLLLLSATAFGQDLSADADKAVDKWVKKFVKALKKQDVDKVMPFFYDQADIKTLIENTPGGAVIDNEEEIWNIFETNKRRNVEQTLQQGVEHGVNWKKVKLVEISYREVMHHERSDAIESVLKLYLESEGEDFILLLSPCLYLNGEWNLADYVLFETEDHHH